MSELEKTYQLEVGPEKPNSWSEQRRLIAGSWMQLLNRTPPPSENEVQRFLEENPSLVPGALGVGASTGKYPDLLGVVRQAPLPSYDKRVPDFLWLSGDSETVQPVLVEIEAPAKRWFTKSDKQSHQLTQALDQIAEWKSWFNVSHNVDAFRDFYGLNQWPLRKRFKPAYILVFGRREEANANAVRIGKRANLAPQDVMVMTFDRLAPLADAEELCCIEAVGSQSFRIVTIPPTFTWSPMLARERFRSHGWDEAIKESPHISAVRKEFLVRRRPYWENWSHSNGDWIDPGDSE